MVIAELELLDELDLDLTSLRTGLMGGSPGPVELMKRVIQDMGMHEIAICFGMTENSPVATQTKVDDDLCRRTETVAVPLPHMEVAVKDPVSDEAVEHGSVGQACFRAYSVMLGYWDGREQTAEAADADDWLHTGDLAVMDVSGYPSVVGRLKDMAIGDGKSIYRREVEEFLITHPDIVDAQVAGVPDERLSEELVPRIKLPPSEPPIDAAGLRAFRTDRLSRHKVPRYVKLVEDFPMTVTGRARKVEMREISFTELNAQGAPHRAEPRREPARRTPGTGTSQRPVHLGGRPARNALGPSCASSLSYAGRKISSASSKEAAKCAAAER